MTVPNNCGDPAVAVLRRCRFPVVVQRPIPMVFLLGRPWRLRSCNSTGAVLGSVDDVPVVVQRQVQGQTVQKAVLVPQLRSRSFPVVAQRQVPWSKLFV